MLSGYQGVFANQ